MTLAPADDPEQALQLAMQQHQAGQFKQAESICRQILAADLNQTECDEHSGAEPLVAGAVRSGNRDTPQRHRASPEHCGLSQPARTGFKRLGPAR